MLFVVIVMYLVWHAGEYVCVLAARSSTTDNESDYLKTEGERV